MDIGFADNGAGQVQVNLSRARKIGEPTTLTIEQWRSTLDYFHHRCAYCYQENIYGWSIELEHFYPLGMGIGTVWSNCIPACCKCNMRKRSLHPSKVTLIPSEAMERVQHFLEFLQINEISL